MYTYLCSHLEDWNLLSNNLFEGQSEQEDSRNFFMNAQTPNNLRMAGSPTEKVVGIKPRTSMS